LNGKDIPFNFEVAIGQNRPRSLILRMLSKIAHTLILVVLVAGSLYAQVDKGDRLYAKKDYENALKAYLDASGGSSDDPLLNFKIGVSYLYTEKKSLAVPFLEKAYRIKPEVDEDIDYHLGMAYQNDHQYAKARDHFMEFRRKNKKLQEISNHKIMECEIGDSLTRKPVRVQIENAGPNVNSLFHEYSPLVSGDGKTMVFTSNRSTDEYKIKSGTNFEDIYIARKSGDTWNTPQKISDKINIKFNDAAAWLSADGTTLLLYYEEGAGDIFISKLEGGDWSEPEPLNKNINTQLFWETSACMSPDGKKLYFSSNRPGGRGELDIYVSELDAKGQWGKAINLGRDINTPGNEDSPFIHPDGITLYFSSDGHPSMGSNDIFRSDFKDGKWQKPVNLGFPVNSIEYDGFFTISEDKKTGYYSTLRNDGLGNSDIYKVTFLPEPVRHEEPVIVKHEEPVVKHEEPVKKEEPVLIASAAPIVTPPPAVVETPAPAPVVATPKVEEKPAPAEPEKQEDFVDPIIQVHKDNKVVTVLKGKVIDELSAQPLRATISLVNNETNKVITKITSNPTTGDFELTIPHGGNYGVATEREGYLFNSINFNLPQFAEYQEIDTHIIMVKAEVGSKIVLKNVFFDIGKADLKLESVAEVENIRELLEKNPHLNVQINGHTDNQGNAVTNKALSLKRASAVVEYLGQHGISATRLSAKGFGSERPIVSNDDEQSGREINRRTEIEVIESSQ
jgi:outer membrane protein OmpA-like peptidoglycan-associated protein/tetratricopeptide (TPR) repeat protein